MRAKILMPLLLLLAAMFQTGCPGDGRESLAEGRVTYGQAGLAGAKVEVYLEAGRFRRTSPFAIAYTSDNGHFELVLPGGKYFIVARGESGDGQRLYGEFPGNPVRLGKKDKMTGVDIPMASALASMEYHGPPDSGLRGRVVLGSRPALGSATLGDLPALGAFVYVYESDAQGLIGPGYLTSRAVDDQGAFRLGLHPGRYWIAVRLKSSGQKAGFVALGDHSAVYHGNPVAVEDGRFTDLGTIYLHPVDEERLGEISAARRRPGGETGLSGSVLDGEGRPVPEMYVLVYDHPQMIGRPLAMAATDEEGRFSVKLVGKGEYFLGAREVPSGPRSPGEIAGGYEGTPDHSVTLEEGQWLENLIIRVEEVW